MRHGLATTEVDESGIEAYRRGGGDGMVELGDVDDGISRGVSGTVSGTNPMVARLSGMNPMARSRMTMTTRANVPDPDGELI